MLKPITGQRDDDTPPRVIVYGGKSSNIRLNPAAFAALGRPSRVLPLRDDQTGALHLRPVAEDTPGSLAVVSRGSQHFISGVVVKRAMGWEDATSTVHYTAAIIGGELVVGDPVEPGDDD